MADQGDLRGDGGEEPTEPLDAQGFGGASGGRVHDVESGAEIENYRLIERIGEGGFGEVWLAEQSEPVRRRVALKLIKVGMDTRALIARFEAERQALALMDHPCIARVFDAGATALGRPYFVMEWVQGSSITDYCNQRCSTVRERVELLIDVCMAVQHAHQKGVIHRDLKPSNVLVTVTDGRAHPKVIDFGIAKAIESRLTEKTIVTDPYRMMGTPIYMSPEQAGFRSEGVDTRTDIYSLGVLAYELLTGSTPFSSEELLGGGIGQLHRVIQDIDPPKPSTKIEEGDTPAEVARLRGAEPRTIVGLVRGELDWIVMKCLQKDRAERYSSAGDLARDLRAHLGGEPVSAAPPGRRYRVGKFVRHNRALVGAVGSVIAALMVGAAGTTLGMVWAFDERDRADAAAEDAEEAAHAAEVARDEADANAERALAQWERAEHELARAREVKRVTRNMLTSIDPKHARTLDTTLLRKILDRTAQRIEGGWIEDERIEAEVRSIICETYTAIGEYAAAVESTRRVLEIHVRHSGPEHRDTIDALSALAFQLIRLGRPEESIPYNDRALELSRRVLGPEHPLTLRSLNNRSTGFRSLGRLDEAEASQRVAVEQHRIHLGEDDYGTLMSRVGLGAILSEKNDPVAAAEEFEQAYQRLAELFGDDHPGTLMARLNRALNLGSFRRFDEVEEELDSAVQVSVRVLGPGHPDILRLQSGLAILRFRHGRGVEDAESMMRETLEAQERVLGEAHPDPLATKHNLAALLEFTGSLEEAEELYRAALEGRLATFGEFHPQTMSSRAKLTYLLAGQGRFPELVEHMRAAVPSARMLAERDGGAQLTPFLHTYGFAQLRAGELEGAEETLLEVHARLTDELGGEHPVAVGTADLLVEVYEGLAEENPEEGHAVSAEHWRGLGTPREAAEEGGEGGGAGVSSDFEGGAVEGDG